MILSPKVSNFVCCPVLGHQERAGIGKCVNEPGYGDVGIWGMVDAEAESRISRCAKIDVKFPAMHLSQSHAAGGGAIDRDEKLIPARRRRHAPCENQLEPDCRNRPGRQG